MTTDGGSDDETTAGGNVPAAAQARRLVRACDRAALATLQRGDGGPYASLVLAACDYDASPILLLSDLAEHAANIAADGRVSLLFDGTAGLVSPLTGARVSVQGRAAKSGDERLRARYLARHPDAEGYAGFADFAFYRVEVGRAHLVAGFGRIDWVERGELLYRPGDAGPAAWEAGVVEHMNADHADAVDLYARRLLGGEGSGWRLTGCDAEGADLRRDGEVLRLDFDAPAETPAAVREAFVALAARARRRADGEGGGG